MARIGFFVLPNPGGMNACLKLAGDLDDRGHNVVYLGLADSRDYIESNGFEFHTVFEQYFPNGYFKEDLSRESLVKTLQTLIVEAKHFRSFFEHIFG